MWVLRSLHERVSFNVYKHIDNILGTLSQHGILATFFITGEMAEKHPEIPRKICKYEHEIASHGYSHARFSETGYVDAERDVLKSIVALNEFQEVKGFRAPFLVRNKATYLACEKLGLSYDSSEYGLLKYCPNGFRVTILPVISPLDTHGLDLMRLQSEDLVAKWLSGCKRSIGAAICMHAWRMGRKKYIKGILKPLLNSDLTFLKACELLRKDGVALTFDVEYTSFSESVPHNLALLKSPAWKHPKSLVASEFLEPDFKGNEL